MQLSTAKNITEIYNMKYMKCTLHGNVFNICYMSAICITTRTNMIYSIRTSYISSRFNNRSIIYEPFFYKEPYSYCMGLINNHRKLKLKTLALYYNYI